VAADPPPLRISRLRRRLGSADVVQDLSLTLGPGDRIALRGPNGSGKTTVLRCAAGTMAPTSGVVEVGGAAAGSFAARARCGVALAQERSFFMRLSGLENLRYFARARLRSKAAAEREVAAVLSELGLESIATRRMDRCSTGMVQQLGFARALLGSPAVLLLDEPTRSLDTAAVERLWEALERRPATALLISTHHDDDAARCGGSIDLPR
jgi:ABC-type multidrug transport system ATPase subunit